MAKRNTSKAFYKVKVTYESGKVLDLTFSDFWEAHEVCNRANILPGVKVAQFNKTGYNLFSTWESAMESVAAFCDTDSPMARAYMRGENPLG